MTSTRTATRCLLSTLSSSPTSRARVAERFRTGEGVGWHEHHDGLFRGTERSFGANYRMHLVSEWLPALTGVAEKLDRGASVADVGCGHGASTILMAQAFPASTFTGIDVHAASSARARTRAQEAGVADRGRFEVADATRYAGGGYDLIAFFDALHDLGDPVGAAGHARGALAAARPRLVGGRGLRPHRVLRRPARSRRSGRRGGARPGGPGRRRLMHARRAVRR